MRQISLRLCYVIYAFSYPLGKTHSALLKEIVTWAPPCNKLQDHHAEAVDISSIGRKARVNILCSITLITHPTIHHQGSATSEHVIVFTVCNVRNIDGHERVEVVPGAT